jgi:hypothetical protein
VTRSRHSVADLVNNVTMHKLGSLAMPSLKAIATVATSLVLLCGCSDPLERVVTPENNLYLIESSKQKPFPSISETTLAAYEFALFRIRYAWRWSQLVMDNHLTIGALCDPISYNILEPSSLPGRAMGFSGTSVHKSEDDVLYRGWTYREMAGFWTQNQELIQSLGRNRNSYCEATRSVPSILVYCPINK